MRTITSLVSFFWALVVPARKLSALAAKVDRHIAASARANAELTFARAEMARAAARYERARARAEVAADEVEKVNRGLQEALDAAREELVTAREITIPGLVASHRALINRWEAEAAVSAARRDLVVPPRDENS